MCLERLVEAGTRRDQFHVRWQCILGTWPSDGKGFVSYMKFLEDAHFGGQSPTTFVGQVQQSVRCVRACVGVSVCPDNNVRTK